MAKSPITFASFSTSKSRRLRFGCAPDGSDQRLRDRTSALAAELDRIHTARQTGDVSPSEARAQSAAAIKGYRAAVESLASSASGDRHRVLAAGEALQDRVRQKLAALTPYELLRVQRRAAAIETDTTAGFDAARALEARDTEGLLALALINPSAGSRALACLFGNDHANQLVAGAATLRQIAAAEAAVAAADELSKLDEPWHERHNATPADVLTNGMPAASSLAPDTWPRWCAEFLDITPPAPPAEARQTTEGAA